MRGGLLRGKPPLLFLRFGILAGQGSFLYAESRNKQNWRDIDMRFLLKILFAPILAVLAVVTWFFVFVVGLSSGILCIPAAILGFFGLFILFVDSVSYGVGLLVIAFLICQAACRKKGGVCRIPAFARRDARAAAPQAERGSYAGQG